MTKPMPTTAARNDAGTSPVTVSPRAAVILPSLGRTTLGGRATAAAT